MTLVGSNRVSTIRFNDPYTATNKIQLGYIGGRSIVFHDASGARIACASLEKVELDVTSS